MYYAEDGLGIFNKSYSISLIAKQYILTSCKNDVFKFYKNRPTFTLPTYVTMCAIYMEYIVIPTTYIIYACCFDAIFFGLERALKFCN